MGWAPAGNILGPEGPIGPPGPGMVFKGQVATVGDLPLDALPGDAYTVLADGHMYVWDGTTWIDGGSVVGAEGPDGPVGPIGPAGPGVPVGGTTGQVLAKINATDFNTQWSTLPPPPPPVSIGDSPPASPIAGQLWWESDSGNTYIWYNDGSSSQWVPAVSQVGPAGPAGQWTEITQAAYDALSPPDPDTLYVVVG